MHLNIYLWFQRLDLLSFDLLTFGSRCHPVLFRGRHLFSLCRSTLAEMMEAKIKMKSTQLERKKVRSMDPHHV